LFLEVPLQFFALWAAKRAFLSGKSLKTEVFKDSFQLFPKTEVLENPQTKKTMNHKPDSVTAKTA